MVKYARDLRLERDVVERRHWTLSKHRPLRKRSSPPSGAETSHAVAPIPRTDLEPWSNAAAGGPGSPPTHCTPGLWALRRTAGAAEGAAAATTVTLGSCSAKIGAFTLRAQHNPLATGQPIITRLEHRTPGSKHANHPR